jgi:hypothetical protein
LRESCAVDHQANKSSNTDAPNDGQKMKCIHYAPQKR